MEEMTVEKARELLMASLGDEGESASLESSASGLENAEAEISAAKAALLEDTSATEDVLGESAYALFDENNVGLGVDIVEIDHMAAVLERTPTFAEQVFSEAERAYCEKKANSATHYALRFAAKEAVVKALGTGFAEGIWVHDIEVERSKSGKPLVKLSGQALQVARERGVREFSLSLSYTHNTAVACALAITESSMRASQKRKDSKEELAQQFKEVRGILDEL